MLVPWQLDRLFTGLIEAGNAAEATSKYIDELEAQIDGLHNKITLLEIELAELRKDR